MKISPIHWDFWGSRTPPFIDLWPKRPHWPLFSWVKGVGEAMAKKFDRDGIPISRPTTHPRGQYAVAAPYYWELGYKPIPVRGKVLLVKGATGYGGEVTPEKFHEWCSEFPYADIALRAEGWLGIDIDAHGGKRGSEQLAELEHRLGPLPETYSSTSRGRFSNSRIYLYRVLEDVPRRSRAAKHIDVVHRFHRYMVVSPSTHPQTGDRYDWYGPDGELRSLDGPPHPSELALLPASWDHFLKTSSAYDWDPSSARPLFSGAIEDWEHGLDSGSPSEEVQQLLERIARCPHIGHNELLAFVGDIEELSNGSQSSGINSALQALKAKYFEETNESNPEKEWENILRWFISDDWQDQRTAWQSFMAWVAQLSHRKGANDA